MSEKQWHELCKIERIDASIDTLQEWCESKNSYRRCVAEGIQFRHFVNEWNPGTSIIQCNTEMSHFFVRGIDKRVIEWCEGYEYAKQKNSQPIVSSISNPAEVEPTTRRTHGLQI